MRFYIYCAVSTVLAILVLLLPLMNRPNFFSASIAISQNSACMIVLANMGLIISLLLGKFVQKVFFGQLHALETERLYERAWYAVTESALILPLFRDESKIEFVVFFGFILFLRMFHWICSDRIDIIFQTGRNFSYLNHIRLSLAILTLTFTDIYLIRCWVMAFPTSSDTRKNSIMVSALSFECLLLLNSILTTAGKYVLNVIESIYLNNHEDEDIWDRKNSFIFYIEVMSTVTRLVACCLLFFFVMLPNHILPLHILRNCYVNLTSLISLVNTHLQSRRAKSQIENVVQTATAEELSQTDDVCIICREEMVITEGQPLRFLPKKLLCGHIIHQGCLMSWLERSLRCPTCRRSVLDGRLPDQPAGAAPVPAPANNQNTDAPPPQNEAPHHNENGANNGLNGNHADNTQPINSGSSASRDQYSQQEVDVRANMMLLYPDVVLPDRFQVPSNWGVVGAFENKEGALTIRMRSGCWISSQLQPSGSLNAESSSTHQNTMNSLSDSLEKSADIGEKSQEAVETTHDLHSEIKSDETEPLSTFKHKGKVSESHIVCQTNPTNAFTVAKDSRLPNDLHTPSPESSVEPRLFPSFSQTDDSLMDPQTNSEQKSGKESFEKENVTPDLQTESSTKVVSTQEPVRHSLDDFDQ